MPGLTDLMFPINLSIFFRVAKTEKKKIMQAHKKAWHSEGSLGPDNSPTFFQQAISPMLYPQWVIVWNAAWEVYSS